jgi:hypothetical protein
MDKSDGGNAPLPKNNHACVWPITTEFFEAKRNKYYWVIAQLFSGVYRLWYTLLLALFFRNA